ncbi:MAG: membrane protein insertase YidC [Actinobacteria bacterium]|nr:membrane protein insertase YidC [Actinomycetota bacterium]
MPALPDLLLPLKLLVAAVLAVSHDGLVGAGLAPGSGAAWALAIVLLVVVVRAALLPAVWHGVRTAHAAARARPALTQLRDRYAARLDAHRRDPARDPDALREMLAEQRAVQAEHGMSRLGCLPALAQVPVLVALYAVLTDVAAGRPVGAMDAALVASAGSASLLGAGLADRFGGFASTPGQGWAVVLLLAGVAAALSFATQHWFVLPNTVLTGLPEPMRAVQRLLPAASAVGVVAAATAVPVGVLVYWVAGNAWMLGQQAAIARWWPTPGSAAAEAQAARRARRTG